MAPESSIFLRVYKVFYNTFALSQNTVSPTGFCVFEGRDSASRTSEIPNAFLGVLSPKRKNDSRIIDVHQVL